MVTILLVRNPLKVIRTIVQFVTVNMIYLWLIIRVRNIKLSDKAMDKNPFPCK